MPDENLPDSLIVTARKLLPAQGGDPSQADQRRAISTAYYAVFHALARCAANSLVGDDSRTRPKMAWVEVYRGLGHGTCKQACRRANTINFPEEIHIFADEFVQLHAARENADYDPFERPNLETARLQIDMAEKCIQLLNDTPLKDKIAFVSWVLITSRGAELARKRSTGSGG